MVPVMNLFDVCHTHEALVIMVIVSRDIMANHFETMQCPRTQFFEDGFLIQSQNDLYVLSVKNS